MLQTIRERLTGWFAVFILGAIALTLVVTFGNIDTGFSAGSAAATVNGEDVPLREFRQVYQRQRQQWETAYRAQLPDLLAEEMANSVIQSMIRNRVVAQHVDDAGYRVNDDDLVASIMENQAFYVGGQFSQPAYEQLLQSQGLSTQRFEYEQRQSMQIQQFIEGLGYTAFFTPSEFRRYIELDGESRDIEYTILESVGVAVDIEISEEAIASYYEVNQAQFQTEEAVSLNFIEVDFSAIEAVAGVTEEDARLYFDENPDEFRGADERKASHILIQLGDDETAAAELAAQVSQRAAGGEEFALLAAEFSADTGSAETGGDLGWLGSGDSPAPEFEEALFSLAEGEVSEPVRTDFGFHIIRLDGVRAGDTLEFENVRDELTARLREDVAAEIYGEQLDELDERALESLDGLAPVAEAMGLELQQVENFTRSGGEPLGFDPALVDLAFSLELLEDGENSPAIEIAEGRAVVVQVTDYRQPQTRPLSEVKTEIEAQLRGDEAIALVGRAGGEMVENLNAGADIAADMSARGLAWSTQEAFRRGGTELPADLAAAVFQAPKPGMEGADSYFGRVLASGDYAVYRILAVNSGAPEDYSLEDRDIRKRQLAERLGGGHANAVVEALVTEANINITPNLIGNQDGLL